MIAQGDLRADRIGRQWLVLRNSVQEADSSHRGPGRRWSDMAAWALIARASSAERPPGCSSIEWSRAGQRLRERGLVALLPKLASRAAAHRYYAHPAVLPRLSDDPRIVRSGVSAAGAVGADIVALDEFEGYILRGDLAEVVRQHGLISRDDGDSNVRLRVVAGNQWPVPAPEGVALPLIVAVDLCESDDERSRRAGRELLEQEMA